ncbi:MAG: hypothetical protein A2W35_21900 [Chloroflexi bacterium RBG_16_57_11]|nr:MAG: hypothetical protein A2W35_21900 [Chloroflexi bacterium RBG_16_57_11]
MEFKEGTSVMTADGKVAGRLRRVVIDPETNQVTHIVIQSGLIDRIDRVVDVQRIGSASRENVTLLCIADDLELMPPFNITQYTPVDSQVVPLVPMSFANPLPAPPMIVETNRSIPEDLIALKEGAPVFSVDDEHVGNVKRVITDPEDGQITRLIVAKGLILKENKSIPIAWVDVLGEDKVSLIVDSQQIKDLPEFQE